jgi:hypothetical protein
MEERVLEIDAHLATFHTQIKTEGEARHETKTAMSEGRAREAHRKEKNIDINQMGITLK